MYLVLGGVSAPGGCTGSRGVYLVLGGVPGPGGCLLRPGPGGCTWSWGGLLLGGVPGLGGVCSWGCVPGPGGVDRQTLLKILPLRVVNIFNQSSKSRVQISANKGIRPDLYK